MGAFEDKDVSFELTPNELADAASRPSEVVPNVVFFGKTAFTIENAPIPKSVEDALGAEKTITVTMKVRLDRPETA